MDSGSGGDHGRKPPAGPKASGMPPASPKASRAFLYTPFGGAHALDAALGENMVRVNKGKQPHPLIAPSHAEANRMEEMRQVNLANWKGKLDAANHTLRRHHGTVVASGYTHKMRMRQIAHDKSLDQGQRREAVAKQKLEHELSTPTSYLLAKADKALYAPKYQALEQTRIANTTVNVEVHDTPAHPQWPHLFPAKRTVVSTPRLYPSLHPDPSPLENIGRSDKLYVLGHGAPVSDALPKPGLYATPSTSGPTLSPDALAKHLGDAGLPRDFRDLRLTSCQSVPTLDENGPHAAAATRDSGFLAPELSKAVKAQFPNLSVTGYMGNGVTFPFDADHHQRADPGDASSRAPRKALAIKFPPL